MIDYAPATGADLDDITRLLAECALAVDDLSPALLRYFLTARERGRLVGCIGVEPLGAGFALLRSLAVAADRRGVGIAERLCDQIEALARAQSVTDIYLLTTSAADYFAARGYERLDRSALPAPVQATSQFRELCPETAVAMRKGLGAGGQGSGARD